MNDEAFEKDEKGPYPGPLRMTRMTSSSGFLAKKLIAQEDGEVLKESVASMRTGEAERITLSDLSDLPQIILSLSRNQALATGCFDIPVAKICTASRQTPELHAKGHRARTKKNMRQPKKGVALLDFDTNPYMPRELQCLSAKELMSKMARADDRFGTLAFVGAPSSSGGITISSTGQPYGSCGYHVYFAASNVDIAKLRRFLEVRLWACGLGYIAFARNGSLLVRFIVDLAVLSPERLIIEAPPELIGLEQAERNFEVAPGRCLEGDFEITDDDWATHCEAVETEKAKPAIQAKAAEIRSRYVEDKALELAELEVIALPVARERIRSSMPRPDGDLIWLPGDYPLDMGDTFLLARDLLKPEIAKRYNNRAIPDPIEGRAYGRGTAKFWWNDGQPCINSLAHGASTHYLFDPFEVQEVETEISVQEVDASAPRSLSALRRYSLNGQSGKLEQQISDEFFVIPDLALAGQWTVWYASPNTGKTLIVFHLLIDSLRQNPGLRNQVYYVNADDTLKGLVQKLKIAEEMGFHLLVPGEMGFTAQEFVSYLHTLLKRQEAAGTVIILDTLKKFIDLMDKSAAAQFGRAIRRFVQKGGTIIALAHVNKKVGTDGKPVPEGTADVINDCDCAYLIYEISRDDEAQEKVVLFENKKNRGQVVHKAAFRYSTAHTLPYDELVSSVERVEIDELEALEKAQDENVQGPIIEAIRLAMADGHVTKMKLRDEASTRCGASRRQVLQVIEKFTGDDPGHHKWIFKRAEHGRQVFSLLAPTETSEA